jgi:hypothetical protein
LAKGRDFARRARAARASLPATLERCFRMKLGNQWIAWALGIAAVSAGGCALDTAGGEATQAAGEESPAQGDRSIRRSPLRPTVPMGGRPASLSATSLPIMSSTAPAARSRRVRPTGKRQNADIRPGPLFQWLHQRNSSSLRRARVATPRRWKTSTRAAGDATPKMHTFERAATRRGTFSCLRKVLLSSQELG